MREWVLMRRLRRAGGKGILLGVGLVLVGCQSPPSPVSEPVKVPEPQASWLIFDAKERTSIDWDSLLARLAVADIVVIGERHNDVAGHQLKAELIRDLLQNNANLAVAMEMFERDEQGIVDLYLDGKISKEALVKVTGSASWGGGTNTWDAWYQPIVDAVRAHHSEGAVLIAANSVRAFVTLARLEGFGVLEDLRDGGNQTFVVPDLGIDDSAYRQRFVDLMSPKPHATNGSDAPPRHAAAMDPAAFFRAQQVWDASMADAVVRAAKQERQVVLIAGDFHVAFEGGTLLRIRHRLPAASIVSLSIVPFDGDTLSPDDHRRADFVVYTRLK